MRLQGEESWRGAVQAGHMTQRQVEEVDLCHCSALGVCAHHYVLRMFKAILGHTSICSSVVCCRTMELAFLSEALLSFMSLVAHPVPSCVVHMLISLKSCTITTVNIVIIHDDLEPISSISLYLVSASVSLSTSLTELLVSAASSSIFIFFPNDDFSQKLLIFLWLGLSVSIFIAEFVT